MTKSLRKLQWSVILVWILFVAMTGSPAFAAEKLPSEKAYLQDLYINMLEVNSLQFDMTLKAETPMGEIHLAMNGEAREKPLGMKNDVHVTLRDPQNAEFFLSMQQYLIEDKDHLIMYLYHDDTWIKEILPLFPSLKAKATDKKMLSQNMWRLMKSVELIRETPSSKYLKVTLDTMAVNDLIGETAKQHAIQDKGMLSVLATGRLCLLAAGDLTYHVKVDKAAQQITEIEIDLTGPVRKAADLLLDIIDPRNKTQVEAFLAESTLTMQIAYSQHNQIGRIEVPQEARDTAREIKSDKEMFRTNPFRLLPGLN